MAAEPITLGIVTADGKCVLIADTGIYMARHDKFH
jgi:hypothetical protein